MKIFFSLIIGILFGIISIKSEIVSWDRIRAMFEFQEAHMYLIIGSAVIVGAISVLLIKAFHLKNLWNREEISFPKFTFNKGYVIGGIIFGLGWAITGACPGPIFSQIGSGEFVALFSLAGAIIGTLVYSVIKPKLPH